MRKWTALAALAALTVGTATVADAKPKTDDAAASTSTADAYSMQVVGYQKIDDFFATAKAPLDTLVAVRTSIDSVGTNLNTALGLAAGTPLQDALNDLKAKANGKITVAMNGTVPKLSSSDALPGNVAQGMEAVNSGLANVGAGMKSLDALPAQFSALIDQSKQFTDPDTLKGIITDAGGNVTQVPKALSTTKKNIDTLTKAKDEPAALKTSFTGIVTTVSNTFK